MAVGENSKEDDLRAQLEAERAATEHWRQVATQRSAEYAQLRHRCAVRALLALERRLGPITGRVATLANRGSELGERSLFAFGGVGGRASRRLDEPGSALRCLPPPPPIDRSITLVVVGSLEDRRRRPVEPGGTALEDGLEVHRLPGRSSLDGVRLEVLAQLDGGEAARRGIELEGGQPAGRSPGGRLGHEGEPGKLAECGLVAVEDGPAPFDPPVEVGELARPKAASKLDSR